MKICKKYFILIFSSLIIKTKIWKKDTDDLFDFEAEDIKKNEIKINSFYPETYLISNNEEIFILNSNQDLQLKSNKNYDSSFLILSEINYSNNSFIINNPIHSFSLKEIIKNKTQITRTWKISQRNKETEIKEGDIIKLGRVRLKFDKICIKNNLIEQNKINILKQNTNNVHNNSYYNLNLSNNNITNVNQSLNESKISNDKNIHENINEESSSNQKYYCRICYKSDSDIENPLISPCKCSGSMQYIHYKCLKHFIDIKMQKKIDENFKFYTWKNFECEICKYEYPKYLKYKNTIYPMVDIENDYDSYAICDYTLFDDNKKRTFRKGLIIFKINEENDEITVGRTQSNKIKLKDISVSRTHCSIIKKNNSLFICDKGSKFGTLIYMNCPINLYLNQINDNFENLISGRFCFSIGLIQNYNFFEKMFFFNLKCCKCKNINDKEVDIENLKQSNSDKLLNNDRDNNCFDDSYEDYILEIGTIIRAKDDNDDMNNNEKKSK